MGIRVMPLDLLPLARSIVDLDGWIVCHVRPDAFLAFVTVSQNLEATSPAMRGSEDLSGLITSSIPVISSLSSGAQEVPLSSTLIRPPSMGPAAAVLAGMSRSSLTETPHRRTRG